MRLPDQMRKNHTRAAFTLIELVVVIAIITLLVSLTAAAVIKVIAVGNQTATRTEIGQMEVAIQNVLANQAKGANFIPSKLTLYSSLNQYTNSAVDVASKNFLISMFGRHFGTGNVVFTWNPNSSANPLTLEGEEVLVFILGGIPSFPTTAGGVISMTGFSTDGTNPTAATAAGVDRIKPFFEFKTNRLQATTNFVRYLDPYGSQPYLYFACTTNAGNNYNTNPPDTNVQSNGQLVQPYYFGNTFFNPRGFQIISAGADMTFGPGGSWDPTKGYATGHGVDDIANFSRSMLGVQQY